MPKVFDWQALASDDVDYFTSEPIRRSAPAFPDHRDYCRCNDCK